LRTWQKETKDVEGGQRVIRLSTIVQDRKIMKLIARGYRPKAIVTRLNLLSVYVVYEAIRRVKNQNSTNTQSANLV
jgi:hypothetical protein